MGDEADLGLLLAVQETADVWAPEMRGWLRRPPDGGVVGASFDTGADLPFVIDPLEGFREGL